MKYSVTKVRKSRVGVIIAEIILLIMLIFLLVMFREYSYQFNSGEISQLTPDEDLIFAGFCFIALLALFPFAEYDDITGLQRARARITNSSNRARY
jgi:ABC-type transport system involved in multi-copper enzyme maturation permease subunit